MVSKMRRRTLSSSTDATVHATESDARYGSFDFRAAHAEAPADLQALLDQHESLPFRRRGARTLVFLFGATCMC